MTDASTDIENRSEIVFVTDAEDCNPNGNPLGENRPRRDPVTGRGAVTDVRLKRYVRDQLHADDHGVFVKKTADGTSGSRAALALDVLKEVETAEDVEQVEDIESEFLASAADVRYFGATLSFNRDADKDSHEAIYEAFEGGNYTGPVQFSPARSLNEVQYNEEMNSLTSVISTGDDKGTGGYDLDDHRIKYGIFPFHGLVNENGAADTGLTAADVERLDTLCWRAMKNQTISRSKVGQEPRLYLRVEYAGGGYHAGDLHNGLSLDRELASDDDVPVKDDAVRDVTDVCLDVTGLVDRLQATVDRIETVHVLGSDFLEIAYEGDGYGHASDLPDLLETKGVPVHRIDVYSEFERTLPDAE